MADLIIKNCNIIDGSGRQMYNSDLIIEDGKIILIGDSTKIKSDKEIDAEGKVVCPGFIDIHSHADLTIYRDDHPDLLEPLIRQGITTFIGGNCGMALAPLDEGENFEAQKFYIEGFTSMKMDESISWKTLDQFLSHLENKKIALNAGMLAPHGVIRLGAIGMKLEHAKDEDIKKMSSVLEQTMEEGAFGMSAGLQYFPGLYSNTDELVKITNILKKYDGRYSSHIRSYTKKTIKKAINEAIKVASVNDIHAQISHLFVIPWYGFLQRPMMKIIRYLASHPDFANKVMPDFMVSGDMKNIIRHIDSRRDKGVRVGVDVMPTTTGFTHLLAFFPPWVLTGSRDEIFERLSSPDVRKQILQDIETGKLIWPHSGRNTWSLNLFKTMGWECATVMAVASDKNKPLQGKTLFEIAQEQSKHPLDVACDLLLEENGSVLIYESPGEPEDTFTERAQYPALQYDNSSIVTDTILMGFGRPSYLFYGCYPKFLGYYSRQKNLLPLEAAVRKCTSLPAQQMGIKNRGQILPGYYADLVIFDKDKISTDANFKMPDLHPHGIEYVIINGKPVVDKGSYNKEAFAGKVLRRE